MKKSPEYIKGDYKPDVPDADAPTLDCIGVFETRVSLRPFAVILAALLWSQYEFVAD
ncbi:MULTISPECIES: hypothetical protein [Pseudomonas]|jgi:hypothetical protein|uniref:hypothetical protein n=1 Tax=Pseudomonas TaxID=286 RepID=UPI0013CE9F9E|nr:MULTISPECIES: hypothetical protein [Pseudomonas]